jgi:two-component system, NarL family, nitrate/nitrite response regulator NarL
MPAQGVARAEIVTAVLNCARGRDVISPALSAFMAGEIRFRAAPSGPIRSPCEREVLNLIAAGLSIPMMASKRFLAPSTVKTHVQRLYEKLGVSDRAAAVAEAMRRGLLDGVGCPGWSISWRPSRYGLPRCCGRR